ncbi:MAG TPA: ribonuclease HI family protein [Enterococcus columbae]|nr:ribonuclease HI family protein [Enterococcus columbae]
MIKAYIDAAVKANPGPAGLGIVIITDGCQEQLCHALSYDLNNHQAEFEALIFLLDELLKRKQTHTIIQIYSDSKIVVQTIEKNYTNNPMFTKYLKIVNQKLAFFDACYLQWIPEAQNKGADNLARQGLQKALKNRRK